MTASRARVDFQAEIQSLREENERLRLELEGTETTANRKNKMTDAAIMQKFNNICDDMEQWINAILADTPPTKSTRSTGAMRITKTPVLDNLYQHGVLPPELDNAANLEYLQLTLTITDFLMDEVFDHPYPVGLRKAQRKELHDVEHTMESLGNDRLTITTWRLDTVRALVSQRSFERDYQDAMQRLLRRAEKLLQPWMPAPHTFADNEPQFKRDLLESAIQIHQAMKTSPDRYVIFKPRIKALPTQFLKEQHGSFQLIDIDTWQKTDERNVQTVLCPLFPGVVREPADSEGIDLVKPALVVSKSSTATRSPQRAGTENLHAMYDKSGRSKERIMRRTHSDVEPASVQQKDPMRSTGGIPKIISFFGVRQV